MNKTVTLGLLLCILWQTLHAAKPASQAEEAAATLATQVCATCHGSGGISTLPTFPNLAAQQQQYLVAKIKVFRNKMHAEKDTHDDMLGLTLIDDATAEALGRYFAHQPPPLPMATDDALVAAGGKVFVRGLPDRGIAACASCHGPNALGNGIFPRLAGQPAEYVVRQLTAIQSRLRDSPIMHGIIKDLKPDEMKAVAAFVQSK